MSASDTPRPVNRPQLWSGAGRDSGELHAGIAREGRRLILLLAGLVRASRLYELNNEALGGPADELAETLAGLIERLGAVHLVFVEDQAYVNDVRLRCRPSEQSVVERLGAELGRHDAGGLSFCRPLASGELRRLAREVASPARGPRAAAELRARLSGLGDVEVPGRFRFRIGEDDLSPRDSRETPARAERAIHHLVSRVVAGRAPNVLPLRRVAIDLVDSIRARPERAALAPFAGRLGGSERHLVSVCQLSLMLGASLGLPEATLVELGVAALLHDVGYLSCRDPLRHPIAGARVLLRQRGFNEAKMRRLLAVAQHAEEVVDGQRSRPINLFARILHLAEHYDLLVAPRPDAPPRHSPASALARLWARRGATYDPALLALFVRSLGLYPPGTVLVLSDGCWAVVTGCPRDRQSWASPRVRVVRSAAGADTLEGQTIDLRWQRRTEVRRVVEPALLGSALAAARLACLASW